VDDHEGAPAHELARASWRSPVAGRFLPACGDLMASIRVSNRGAIAWQPAGSPQMGTGSHVVAEGISHRQAPVELVPP